MRMLTLAVAAFFTVVAIAADKVEKTETKTPAGTHVVSKTIDIKGEAKGVKLQTLTLGPDGMVYALLGADRYGGKATVGEVQVLDPAGQKLRSWKVNFLSQAITCCPDGTLLVAGDGKLAAFDNSGNVKTELELPYVKEALADQEKIKKKAEEQRQSQIESYEEIVKQQQKELEELKAKDEEKLTKKEKQKIKQCDAQIKMYTQVLEQQKKQNVDDIVKQIISRDLDRVDRCITGLYRLRFGCWVEPCCRKCLLGQRLKRGHMHEQLPSEWIAAADAVEQRVHAE